MSASPLGRLPAPGQTNLGFIYPTLAFKIATTQLFSEAHAEVLPIQLVFTIKVWELRHNNTFAMLGVLYQRATPTIAVSCGTANIDPMTARTIDDKLGANVVSSKTRIRQPSGPPLQCTQYGRVHHQFTSDRRFPSWVPPRH